MFRLYTSTVFSKTTLETFPTFAEAFARLSERCVVAEEDEDFPGECADGLSKGGEILSIEPVDFKVAA